MEENDLPELKTAEDVAGYLALKHANGMKFKDVLDLHTRILCRIGTDEYRAWGWRLDQECPEDVRKYFTHLKDGAHFILEYLKDDYIWYYQEEVDSGEETQ